MKTGWYKKELAAGRWSVQRDGRKRNRPRVIRWGTYSNERTANERTANDVMTSLNNPDCPVKPVAVCW